MKEQTSQADGITDSTRKEIIELCDKAAIRLEEGKEYANKAAILEKELKDVATDMESLKNAPKELDASHDSTEGRTADDLRSQLSIADQAVSTSQEAVDKVHAEIERRASRRQSLPELIAQCRTALDQAEDRAVGVITSSQPLLVQATHNYRIVHRDALALELRLLEQENRTYEATSRLWLARRDLAEQQLQRAIEKHSILKELVAKTQRREANHQAQQARRAAIHAHPAVKEAAARNAELAESNRALVNRMQEVQSLLLETRALSQTVRDRFTDLTKRAEASENLPAIGEMLKTQQDQLPNLEPYRDRLRNRSLELSQLGLDIYEWESARRECLRADAAAESAVAVASTESNETTRKQTVEELRSVLEARADILADMINNAQDYRSQLEELETAESDVLTTAVAHYFRTSAGSR